MKILFVINSYDIGGAERFLLRLIPEMLPLCNVELAVLNSNGPLKSLFRSLGVTIHEYHFKNHFFKEFFRYKYFLSSADYNVVQSFLYISDIITALALVSSQQNVKRVWGIRRSNVSIKDNSIKNIIIFRLHAVLSHFITEKAIFCAMESLENHKKIWFNQQVSCCVPNGINREYYKESVYPICERNLTVGFCGRYIEQKNFSTFVDLSKLLLNNDVIDKIIVSGFDENDLSALDALKIEQIKDQITFLGLNNDMASFYERIDMLVSVSLGEGFPNAMTEAQLYGKPAFCSDVGMARSLTFRDDLFIFENYKLQSMAATIKDFLILPELEKKEIVIQQQHFLLKNYSMTKAAKIYLRHYQDIL